MSAAAVAKTGADWKASDMLTFSHKATSFELLYLRVSSEFKLKGKFTNLLLTVAVRFVI
jgi:hypothetical protein